MKIEIEDVISMNDQADITDLYISNKLRHLREQGYRVQFINENQEYRRDYVNTKRFEKPKRMSLRRCFYFAFVNGVVISSILWWAWLR